MNGLILSAFTALLGCFHFILHKNIRRGKVRESFCAVWCMDAVFSLCGVVVSFFLFHYRFLPYLTLRNLAVLALYLIAAVLFVLLAPSGWRLFVKKSTPSGEEMLFCEYRFDTAIVPVRNFLLILLFALPILLPVLVRFFALSTLLGSLRPEDILGGFCFVAFLILLPMSLRQMLFWFQSLKMPVTETEEKTLQTYRTAFCLRRRNFFL